MKKIIVYICLAFFLTKPIAFAQISVNPTPIDYELPYPGLLPDHPLYALKKLRDRILYILASNPIKKIELSLLFADKKITMAQGLVDKDKLDLASNILEESQLDLLKAVSIFPELAELNNLPAGLLDKVELASKKHHQIISHITLSPNSHQDKFKKSLDLNNQANVQIAQTKSK